jgi:hypothetical protein
MTGRRCVIRKVGSMASNCWIVVNLWGVDFVSRKFSPPRFTLVDIGLCTTAYALQLRSIPAHAA